MTTSIKPAHIHSHSEDEDFDDPASGGAQYNSDDNAQYFDRYANDEIEDRDGIGGDDLSEERDEDQDDDDFNDADDYNCGARPDARKRTASQAYSTNQQLPNKRSTTGSHAAQQPDKAKRTLIPRVLYKAAKSFRLNSESVKKLEDEIVTRIEIDNELPSAAVIYDGARNMKILQNSDVINERVGQLMEAVEDLQKTVNKLEESTKSKSMNKADLRVVATQQPVRFTDGKPTGRFWATVDATVVAMQKRQETESDIVKKELLQMWEKDKKKFGSWDETNLSKGGSKEAALAKVMSALAVIS
ncbi:unnamed protein product [Tilletia controversa]|nr:unnamed protein product [Tilletia controversa]